MDALASRTPGYDDILLSYTRETAPPQTPNRWITPQILETARTHMVLERADAIATAQTIGFLDEGRAADSTPGMIMWLRQLARKRNPALVTGASVTQMLQTNTGLILGLLLIAAAAGGYIWYQQRKKKPMRRE